MIRSIGTIAFLLLALHAAPLHAGPPPGAHDPRIRSLEPELAEAVAAGVAQSPTLRRLVNVIEQSDVVVYLTFDRSAIPHTAGRVTFVTAAAGRRYLRVAVDRHAFGGWRIAILGHELQHVVEIAGAPWVTDAKDLAALYRRIGFGSGTGRTDCYDSQLAIDTGEQVQREMLNGAGSAASR